MTPKAQEIFNKAFELKKAASEIDSEDMFKEADELLKTLCPECDGWGCVASLYQPNNPNLIDLPEEVCKECRGSGVIE